MATAGAGDEEALHANEGLTALPVDVLSSSPTLRAVNVAFNSIASLDDARGLVFARLRYLNVSHNMLAGALPEEVLALPVLEQLDVSYNALTSLGGVARLHGLTSLLAHHNALAEAAGVLDALSGLDLLRTVTLHGNPAFERLAEAQTHAGAKTPAGASGGAPLPSAGRGGRGLRAAVAAKGAGARSAEEGAAAAGAEGTAGLDAVAMLLAARCPNLRQIVLVSPVRALRRGLGKAGERLLAGSGSLADAGAGACADLTSSHVSACITSVTPSYAQAAVLWAGSAPGLAAERALREGDAAAKGGPSAAAAAAIPATAGGGQSRPPRWQPKHQGAPGASAAAGKAGSGKQSGDGAPSAAAASTAVAVAADSGSSPPGQQSASTVSPTSPGGSPGATGMSPLRRRVVAAPQGRTQAASKPAGEARATAASPTSEPLHGEGASASTAANPSTHETGEGETDSAGQRSAVYRHATTANSGAADEAAPAGSNALPASARAAGAGELSGGKAPVGVSIETARTALLSPEVGTDSSAAAADSSLSAAAAGDVTLSSPTALSLGSPVWNRDPEARRIGERVARGRGPRLSTSVSLQPFPSEVQSSPPRSRSPRSPRWGAAAASAVAAADEASHCSPASSDVRRDSASGRHAASAAAAGGVVGGPDDACPPELEVVEVDGEIDPSEVAAVAAGEGYRVTLSGRVLAGAAGEGSTAVDGPVAGRVALRVQPDGTAQGWWPHGGPSLSVSVDTRAAAALRRYKDIMASLADLTHALMSPGSAGDSEEGGGGAGHRDGSPTASDSHPGAAAGLGRTLASSQSGGGSSSAGSLGGAAASSVAFAVEAHACEAAGRRSAVPPLGPAVAVDGYGVGGVQGRSGAVLLRFHEDGGGHHADARGFVLRRWDAGGGVRHTSPLFVADSLEALAANVSPSAAAGVFSTGSLGGAAASPSHNAAGAAGRAGGGVGGAASDRMHAHVRVREGETTAESLLSPLRALLLHRGDVSSGGTSARSFSLLRDAHSSTQPHASATQRGRQGDARAVVGAALHALSACSSGGAARQLLLHAGLDSSGSLRRCSSSPPALPLSRGASAASGAAAGAGSASAAAASPPASSAPAAITAPRLPAAAFAAACEAAAVARTAAAAEGDAGKVTASLLVALQRVPPALYGGWLQVLPAAPSSMTGCMTLRRLACSLQLQVDGGSAPLRASGTAAGAAGAVAAAREEGEASVHVPAHTPVHVPAHTPRSGKATLAPDTAALRYALLKDLFDAASATAGGSSAAASAALGSLLAELSPTRAGGSEAGVTDAATPAAAAAGAASDSRLVAAVHGSRHRTAFYTSQRVGFVLGGHLAVSLSLATHELKLYLAAQAFRYELLVASSTGSTAAAGGGAAGAVGRGAAVLSPSGPSAAALLSPGGGVPMLASPPRTYRLTRRSDDAPADVTRAGNVIPAGSDVATAGGDLSDELPVHVAGAAAPDVQPVELGQQSDMQASPAADEVVVAAPLAEPARDASPEVQPPGDEAAAAAT
jgi:hypothetical protein